MLYCVRFYEKKLIMRKNLLDQKQVQSTVLSDFFFPRSGDTWCLMTDNILILR